MNLCTFVTQCTNVWLDSEKKILSVYAITNHQHSSLGIQSIAHALRNVKKCGVRGKFSPIVPYVFIPRIKEPEWIIQ